MPKQQITSDKISRPSGHFSHATMAEAKGRLLFISGMTAKKADGTMAGIGDPEAQTRQVCENLKAAVEAAGGTMATSAASTFISATWSISTRSIRRGAIISRRRRPPRPWSRSTR